MLFIAGGIGIAPLRAVIQYCLDRRADYGTIDVIYGARGRADLVHYAEISADWPQQPDTRVHLTVDKAEPAWSGHVGFVPDYLRELNPSGKQIALVCGPPVMIKFTLAALQELGFAQDQVYTTLEMRMKCGVGKCGRCNIGSKYVCRDGPVFRWDELAALPDEY